MNKKFKPGITAFACALAALSILGGLPVGPTLAQQNGTHCEETINSATGELQLWLDHTCNAQGEPVPTSSPYSGEGGHDSCYTDWNGSSASNPGVGEVCQPCPSNWERCTPCPNDQPTCGEHTPDPQPPGSGSFFQRVVSAVDWLTA